MAIFSTTYPAYQTVPNHTAATVTTAATQVYNTTGFQPVGAASAFNFPAGVTLSEVTIINTGAVTCWVGSSSVSGTQGIPLKPGEQLTIRGNGHLAAESGNTSWNLWAITASGSTTIEASLATVEATV